MQLWPVEYFFHHKRVMKKVFNWSDLHLSEVTSYKIHTLVIPAILGKRRVWREIQNLYMRFVILKVRNALLFALPKDCSTSLRSRNSSNLLLFLLHNKVKQSLGTANRRTFLTFRITNLIYRFWISRQALRSPKIAGRTNLAEEPCIFLIYFTMFTCCRSVIDRLCDTLPQGLGKIRYLTCSSIMWSLFISLFFS